MSLLLYLSIAHAAVSGYIRASSTLTDEEKVRHPAEQAVDGLLSKGWAEGAEGYGEGSWLDIDLGRSTNVEKISLWAGNLSEGKKSYREHSRPRKVKITLKDGNTEVAVKEVVLEDKVQRVDIPITGAARSIRIDVLEVYEGFVFSDLFISEVAVNFYQSGDRLDAINGWKVSPAALAQMNSHEEKIQKAYAEVKAEEFGDSEGMAFLMDQAGDGPDYLREMVPRLVDVGFRAEALPPDPVAIKALRKLKDPNAIPAIEQAELRSVGADAAEYRELVEIFYAYQELIGGPSYNVPPWGDEGWSPGQLRSFGEPLAIEVNNQGKLYVADTGNNRVQRFNEGGLIDKQWGPEPDITDVWMGADRPWYVSGSAAGDEPGRFRTPLDVELIPDKKLGDGFATLDAWGTVQIFNPQGQRVGGFSVEVPGLPRDGLGGQGYLAWVPKKKNLYVVFTDQLYAYTLEGEVLGQWEIADGVPGAVEATPNGKLYMAFDQQIILYDLDGFRHGTIMDKADLGEGFESMDFTFDEKKKLWVVTDQGVVMKFKRPGRLDYQVQVSDISLIYPRIAALQDQVYITDRDRILTLDALQQKMDDEAAEEQAAEGELEL